MCPGTLTLCIITVKPFTQVTDIRVQQTALPRTTMQSTEATSGIWGHASSGSALNFRPSLVSPEDLLNFGIVVDIELRVLPTVDFDRHTCSQYHTPPAMASYQTVKCRERRTLYHTLDKHNYTTMFILMTISTQFHNQQLYSLSVPIIDRHTCW